MNKGQLQLSTEMRLQQGLSPLQVRYVKLLEMSAPEIEEEVAREIDANPAIEATEPADSPSQDLPARYKLNISNASPDSDRFEHQIEDSGETLADTLTKQLGELDLTPRQIMIAEYVIGNIDGNGYITRSASDIAYDIAMSAGEDVEPQEVTEILDMVRALEPAGVGATDLRECLILQLKRLPSSAADHSVRNNALRILERHFSQFAKMRWDRLGSALGVSDEQLKEAVDLIRTLNPKPGGSIGHEQQQAVIPDFLVEVDDEESEHVTLSMLNNIPELRIAESFRADEAGNLTRQPDSSAREGDFVRRKRSEAEAFLSILRLRQTTLMRIMKAIVKFQHRFFITEDTADLKPMTLKDIAELTGDDLSVLSRSTSGKYVATAGAIYPLRFFFSTATDENGREVSTLRVLDRIREIIDNEDPRNPLGDEAIAAELKSSGYDVARRTVAKYRERLGLPVARLRRKI